MKLTIAFIILSAIAAANWDAPLDPTFIENCMEFKPRAECE